MEIRYSDYQSISLFLEAVAKQCLSEMTEEYGQALRDEPSAVLYHFGVGMYIRNKFIYPQKSLVEENNTGVHDLIAHADDYSQKVIEIMIDSLNK